MRPDKVQHGKKSNLFYDYGDIAGELGLSSRGTDLLTNKTQLASFYTVAATNT